MQIEEAVGKGGCTLVPSRERDEKSRTGQGRGFLRIKTAAWRRKTGGNPVLLVTFASNKINAGSDTGISRRLSDITRSGSIR